MKALVYNSLFVLALTSICAISIGIDPRGGSSNSESIWQWSVLTGFLCSVVFIRAISTPLEYFLVKRDRLRWIAAANLLSVILVSAIFLFESILTQIVLIFFRKMFSGSPSWLFFGFFDAREHDFIDYSLHFLNATLISQMLFAIPPLLLLALLAIPFPGPVGVHDRAMMIAARKYLYEDRVYRIKNRREIRKKELPKHLPVEDQRIRSFIARIRPAHPEAGPPISKRRTSLYNETMGTFTAHHSATIIGLFSGGAGLIESLDPKGSWWRTSGAIFLGISVVLLYLTLAHRDAIRMKKLRPEEA